MRLQPVPLVLLAVLTAPPLSAETISSGRLAQQPERYYGGHVQVTGEIARILDGRAFTLDEDRPLVGPDVLVLAPRPLTSLDEGMEVVVSGYVRRFDVDELRRDYDWFDDAVPRDVLDEADRRPVLVAESIHPAGDERRVERREEKRRSRLVVRDRDRDRDDDEDDDRRPLAVGRNVLLSDARVEQILGDTTFTVRDDDGRELVVRVERKSMLPTEGEMLDISGVVRRVPTAIDTWDLDSDGARRLVRSKGIFVEARRVASAR